MRREEQALSWKARTADPSDRVRLNIREVQMVELDILTAFDEFCKKHGLNYYLCGGTLLGAVRHGGFIPWDDDIDLFMARPGYERLIRICRTESIGENLIFACAENKKFMRPFARIYDVRTDVEREYYVKSSGPHVWLDILPVDGLPEGDDVLRRLFKMRDRLDGMNFVTMWKPFRYRNRIMLIRNLIRYPVAKLTGPGFWCSLLEKTGKKRPFETAEWVGCVTAGRYGKGEAMKRKEFLVPAKVMFEGRTYPTMSCYREYLSGIYRDYMKMPPESKRAIHIEYTTMNRRDYDALCARHSELKNDSSRGETECGDNGEL